MTQRSDASVAEPVQGRSSTPKTRYEQVPTAPEERQALVDSILWFHSIDLGQGVRTKGLSELAIPVAQLPAFDGRSVLDIGAWDGYYTYLAEREGAARMVALDHYAWGVDIVARGDYWNACFAKGELPDHTRDTTDFWRDDLPGRRGFEMAGAILHSKAEAVVADFMTADLDALGTFDVVLYLGVLYHMKEPLTALERVRQVTTEVAVIETEAIHVPGRENEPLLEFYAGGEVNTDFGNWYIPSIGALTALARAAGFSRVETIVGKPADHRETTWAVSAGAGGPVPAPSLKHRIRQAAGRLGGTPPAVAGAAPATQDRPQHFRALVHAYV